MFQKKINELFHGLPNAFGIADNILIAGLDDLGREHYAILDKVLRIHRKANLKLKKTKPFQITQHSVFWRKHIVAWYEPGFYKSTVTNKHSIIKMKKIELQVLVGILKYLRKFSPAAAEVCEPLRKFTLVKAEL